MEDAGPGPAAGSPVRRGLEPCLCCDLLGSGLPRDPHGLHWGMGSGLTYVDEVGPILARHPEPEISPESSLLLYDLQGECHHWTEGDGVNTEGASLTQPPPGGGAEDQAQQTAAHPQQAGDVWHLWLGRF